MKIIGIDPGSAGKKGSAVVEFHKTGAGGKSWKVVMNASVSHAELRDKIRVWAGIGEPDILILWDAPLTGPRMPGCREAGTGNDECYNQGSEFWQRDFTMRGIEQKLLEQLGPGNYAGISVMGYARCPHMAISRNMVGLPILGEYDRTEGLPFELQTKGPAKDSGKFIIETHPAVAMWAWLEEQRAATDDWGYKTAPAAKQKILRDSLFANLIETWRPHFAEAEDLFKEIQKMKGAVKEDDNIFDALIAAVLGWLFVHTERAKIYGNQMDGAMLLPTVDVLEKLLGNQKSET